MSKRQRRRLAERRHLHVQFAKRRLAVAAGVPVAFAIAAAPAVAASPPSAGAPPFGAGGQPAPAAQVGTPSSAVPSSIPTPPQPVSNPDAPPMVPNPAPAADTGTTRFSASGSYYEGLGGGASLILTPQGAWIVPEFGIGLGPSVSANYGSNVNTPSGPSWQLSGSVNEQVGLTQLRGSLSVAAPLGNTDPGAVNVGGNLGINTLGLPAGNVRASGNYSPNSGFTGGVQYSGTDQLFNSTSQLKLAVRVPIPIPNLTQTSAPDANGVSDVVTPTGDGPPAISATRDVSTLGYPEGNGNTVTLNPDGSYTLHTPTSDVTTYGPYYNQLQGAPDNGNGGTLTHQLIDNLGQRTDQYTWQGNDGVTVTQAPNGTLTQTNPDGTTITQTRAGVVTQTNPDHSSVSYDPSTGVITQTDSQGTTTTFNPNGSVVQNNGPFSTTMWDSSGQGMTMTNLGEGSLPISTSDPAPTAPAIPSGISLPHNPNQPQPQSQSSTDNGSSNSNPPSADTTGPNTSTPSTPSTDTTPTSTPQQPSSDTSPPAPAPTDNTPAPAPTDNTPAPAPAPTDNTPAPAPAPTDSTPAPAPTPPPVDTTPTPAPTPPPVDTTPTPAPTTTDTTPTTDTGSSLDTSSTDGSSLDATSTDGSSLDTASADTGAGADVTGGDAGGGGGGGD